MIQKNRSDSSGYDFDFQEAVPPDADKTVSELDRHRTNQRNKREESRMTAKKIYFELIFETLGMLCKKTLL